MKCWEVGPPSRSFVSSWSIFYRFWIDSMASNALATLSVACISTNDLFLASLTEVFLSSSLLSWTAYSASRMCNRFSQSSLLWMVGFLLRIKSPKLPPCLSAACFTRLLNSISLPHVAQNTTFLYPDLFQNFLSEWFVFINNCRLNLGAGFFPSTLL